MSEKFHYQTAEGEKPFDKEQVEDLFLLLNLEKARTLAKEHSLEKPADNVHSAMDISDIINDEMEWQEIIPIIKEGQFAGVNIPTDGVKNTEQGKQIKRELRKHQLEVISFHGSVDPYFIGLTEKPNRNVIKHDFEIADILDSSQSKPINYDLKSAELPLVNKFQKGETLEQIHQAQREKLESKGIKSDKEIIESVIKHVAESRPANSKRQVVFETRQSIILESPEITEENLKFFVETCQKYFDDDSQWGLTVDVGHLLGALAREKGIENVKNLREEIEKNLQVLEKYKQYIKMVHVSGTVTAHTLASYKLAEREVLDVEAVKGWSMHQVIDNQFIVEIVKRLREIKGEQDFIEVSEVRPIHSAAKYFGKTVNFDKK
ncbi:hypothetical protein KKF32_02590 [Patescibacteria group bacterium]|nr:hypothetical protein [Patescibacteria group bacterium]